MQMTEAEFLRAMSTFSEKITERMDKVHSKLETIEQTVTKLDTNWNAAENDRAFIARFLQEFGDPVKLSQKLDTIEQRINSLEHSRTASKARMTIIGAIGGGVAAGLVGLIQWIAGRV